MSTYQRIALYIIITPISFIVSHVLNVFLLENAAVIIQPRDEQVHHYLYLLKQLLLTVSVHVSVFGENGA